MFRISLDTLLGRTNNANPVDETVSFNAVIKYNDCDVDETTLSFASPAEREAHIEMLIASPKRSREIASIVYDDALVFWRRVGKWDALPTQAPDLAGEGDLVIRIVGRKNSVFDATGYSLRKVNAMFTKDVDTFGVPQEMSVIRRLVAYERRSALLKHDYIPDAALRFESADDATDDDE